MDLRTLFRNIGQPRQPHQGGKGVVLAVVLFVVVLLIWRMTGVITDWFWFQEVGYEKIFTVTLLAQLAAAVVFGVAFFIIVYINLFLASRLSDRIQLVHREGAILFPPWGVDTVTLKWLILSGSAVFSLFAALQATSQWENLLRFFNATPFGVSDPLFGRDIGFYVFQLPFLQHIYGWLMTVLVMAALGTAFIYLLRRSLLFIPPRSLQLAPAARAHLLALAAALFFLAALGFWLDLNALLYVKRGVVFGPGYTDATTQLWVLRLLMVLCPLAGASLVYFIFRRDWRIPAFVILAFLAVLIVGREFYPAFVQKFKVIPNEMVLEKPYLEQNIKYTRLAYGLQNIEDRVFPAEENLTKEDLRRNDLTVKNIRLWNHAPLLLTFAQLQEIRTYYKFIDVDNDRYKINGEYRQVMLSPRELSYAALPSRTWVNEHLTYTHGYGAVMGPVNRITREGLPEFFIKDIPPVASTSIKITRPEIYFGEQSNEYVFVKTKRPEFDYPVGDKNVYSRYEGKGGVPLSFFRKILYAVRFGAFTILLSDDITSDSRVMYYRNIKERVSRIAPFARFDTDPYLVISPEGRLLWYVDGYTVTDRFPYSEPTPRLGNYIRNSIKAVVDAYDGSVAFYASDADDPILKTYAKIFPGVFKKLSDMPPELQQHVRYPPGMLSIQARMYRAYHMQDPQVFYNKEDLWAIPRKDMKGADQEMEPYYTIMRLPSEKQEEFILLLPFTPKNKDNMSAWMAARCDAPNYGKVIVYNFPKQKLVYGPRQIEARIDQDTEISKQLSLWNQGGSQVIRGSLLAIPIEKSILYVQSLYLAAEKGQLPELKRVIVAFGNAIAMEENLEQALQRIFGGEMMREKELSAAPAAAAAVKEQTDRQLAMEALTHYRKAQEFLRQGNWGAYGETLKKMEEALRKLEKGR
ncbi:MAG: UPF0182 family protein [Deltaproteobacteria bacterium]|nr:UPF0182 family protein [Deltaproteobacteria bacterium]